MSVELMLVVIAVVVVADEVGLSHSTITGIIVGVVLMLLLLLLVVVLVMVAVRRRRRKSHPSQTSSSAAAARCTSSRSTTSVSTISAGNGSVLPSSFSGVSLAPHHPFVSQPSRAATSDNAGYHHRDVVDEPPPPYSSLSGSPPEQSSQPSVSTTGLSRDRRTGRSLPPTPTRPPPPPASQPRDSLSEHIYDEPSSLFGDAIQPQPDTRPSATLAAYPRSSMSRIRLGTTALRPGTLRCQSPLSVSRQRPRGFGTHQPRRSTYLGSQISELPNDDPVTGSAMSQPFFISNFATRPSDTVHVDSGGHVVRDVDPSARMLAYATATPSMSPHQPGMSELRGGVYDQPWDSSVVIDRVSQAAAIPLTAMPPRSAATLNSSRRHASPQSAWHRSAVTHREPGLSDWPVSAGHTDVFHDDRMHDPVNVWPQHHQHTDSSVPLYPGRAQPVSDFTDAGSALFTGRSDRPRNYYHPRADSSDSCGNSSSSPLVADGPSFSRRCRDNSEMLDLLSPTCV